MVKRQQSGKPSKNSEPSSSRALPARSSRLRRGRRSQSGQATLEYILLLSFVLSLAIGMSRTFITNIDRGIRRFGAQFEKDLKTGRAPLNVWQN